MGYLLLSFIIVNALHGWLVIAHYPRNPATLSYHTLKDRRTLYLYGLTHFVNGILLLGFAREVFIGKPGAEILIAIVFVAVIAEWLQAALPARGKTNIAHTIFAGIMAITMLSLGFIATFEFATTGLEFLGGLFISAVLTVFMLFAQYPPRRNFWQLQFLGQSLLYLQMFILLS